MSAKLVVPGKKEKKEASWLIRVHIFWLNSSAGQNWRKKNPRSLPNWLFFTECLWQDLSIFYLISKVANSLPVKIDQQLCFNFQTVTTTTTDFDNFNSPLNSQEKVHIRQGHPWAGIFNFLKRDRAQCVRKRTIITTSNLVWAEVCFSSASW